MTRILAALLRSPPPRRRRARRCGSRRARPSCPASAAAASEYQRATGRAAAVETAAIGSPDSVAGADVVVAADSELNRVIESGMTHPDQELDVASIPWVAGRPDRRRGAEPPVGRPAGRGSWTCSGARSRARPGAGWRSRACPRALRARRPRREREPREPIRLQPGEAVVVPLSLAGAMPVTRLDVPPLRARALGVRASARPDAASRAFLDFLAGESGGAAFRACGRGGAR